MVKHIRNKHGQLLEAQREQVPLVSFSSPPEDPVPLPLLAADRLKKFSPIASALCARPAHAELHPHLLLHCLNKFRCWASTRGWHAPAAS